MCTMKEVCDRVGISYETLRFYCNEGLVPNVKRDKNNYRDFDERNINWLIGLQRLRKCGMSIKDMKEYMLLCKEGKDSIPARKVMLDQQKEVLKKQINDMYECLDFIDEKQNFYDDVLEGNVVYTSNLITIEN